MPAADAMCQAVRCRVTADSAIPGSSGTRSTVAVGSVCTVAVPNTGSSRSGARSMSSALIEHDQRGVAAAERGNAKRAYRLARRVPTRCWPRPGVSGSIGGCRGDLLRGRSRRWCRRLLWLCGRYRSVCRVRFGTGTLPVLLSGLGSTLGAAAGNAGCGRGCLRRPAASGGRRRHAWRFRRPVGGAAGVERRRGAVGLSQPVLQQPAVAPLQDRRRPGSCGRRLPVDCTAGGRAAAARSSTSITTRSPSRQSRTVRPWRHHEFRLTGATGDAERRCAASPALHRSSCRCRTARSHAGPAASRWYRCARRQIEHDAAIASWLPTCTGTTCAIVGRADAAWRQMPAQQPGSQQRPDADLHSKLASSLSMSDWSIATVGCCGPFSSAASVARARLDRIRRMPLPPPNVATICATFASIAFSVADHLGDALAGDVLEAARLVDARGGVLQLRRRFAGQAAGHVIQHLAAAEDRVGRGRGMLRRWRRVRRWRTGCGCR